MRDGGRWGEEIGIKIKRKRKRKRKRLLEA
jgi:hypothetical protein